MNWKLLSKTVFFLFCATLLFSSCTENESLPVDNFVDFVDYKGVKIKQLTEGEGAESACGDWLYYDFEAMNAEDSLVFNSSYKFKPANIIQICQGKIICGLDSALQGKKSGSVFSAYIPTHLAYGKVSVGLLNPNSNLLFNIKLHHVFKENVVPVFSAFSDSVNLSNGMKKYMVKSGEGRNVDIADQLYFHYSVYDDKGELLETSYKAAKPAELIFGLNKLPLPMHEALKSMKKGEIAKFYIPKNMEMPGVFSNDKKEFTKENTWLDIQLLHFYRLE